MLAIAFLVNRKIVNERWGALVWGIAIGFVVRGPADEFFVLRAHHFAIQPANALAGVVVLFALGAWLGYAVLAPVRELRRRQVKTDAVQQDDPVSATVGPG